MKTIRYIIPALLLILMASSSQAQWQKCDLPYSGNSTINAIAIDGSIIYAGSSKGLFRSMDNGTNWSKAARDTFSFINDGNIFALLSFNHILLAGAGYHGFRSLDSGVTWNEILYERSDYPWMPFYLFLSYGDLCFGGIESIEGLYRSLDRGVSWSVSNEGLPYLRSTCSCPMMNYVDSYFFIPTLAANDKFIFAGTTYSFPGTKYDIAKGWGVYRSADSGASWTQASSGLTDSNIQCFTINGTNLYAGTFNSGVFLTTNNGDKWVQVPSGLTSKNIRSLLAVGSHLFAGTKGKGVFHSADSGKSWRPFNKGLLDTTIAPLAADSTFIYAGSDSAGHIWRFPIAEAATLPQEQLAARLLGLNIISEEHSTGSVSISFIMPGPCRAQLGIYNLSGHLISTIADKPFFAGSHNLQWDTRSVAPGCYMLPLLAGGKVEARVVPVFR